MTSFLSAMSPDTRDDEVCCSGSGGEVTVTGDATPACDLNILIPRFIAKQSQITSNYFASEPSEKWPADFKPRLFPILQVFYETLQTQLTKKMHNATFWQQLESLDLEANNALAIGCLEHVRPLLNPLLNELLTGLFGETFPETWQKHFWDRMPAIFGVEISRVTQGIVLERARPDMPPHLKEQILGQKACNNFSACFFVNLDYLTTFCRLEKILQDAQPFLAAEEDEDLLAPLASESGGEGADLSSTVPPPMADLYSADRDEDCDGYTDERSPRSDDERRRNVLSDFETARYLLLEYEMGRGKDKVLTAYETLRQIEGLLNKCR